MVHDILDIVLTIPHHDAVIIADPSLDKRNRILTTMKWLRIKMKTIFMPPSKTLECELALPSSRPRPHTLRHEVVPANYFKRDCFAIPLSI